MFSNLKLYNIDLSWCGISSIEDGAFDSYPDIRHLYIAGNSLGPRKYELFKKAGSGYLLGGLSISFTAMLSDDQNRYDISPILTRSPYISELLMRGNMIQTLPKLVPTSLDNIAAGHVIYYAIKTLDLNDNSLISLSNRATSELCSAMPNLETFQAANNNIKDVTGL